MGFVRPRRRDRRPSLLARYHNAFRAFINAWMSLACLSACLLGGWSCGTASASSPQIVYAAGGATWGGGDGGGGGAGITGNPTTDKQTVLGWLKWYFDNYDSHINSLTNGITNLTNQLNSHINYANGIFKNYDNHINNLNDSLNSVNANLVKSINYRDAIFKNYDAHIQTIDDAINLLQSNEKNYDNHINNLTVSLDTLSKKLTDANTYRDTIFKNYDAHIIKIDNAITAIQTNEKNYDSHINQLTDSIAGLTLSQADNASKVDSLSKSFDLLSPQVKSLKSSLDDLSTKVDSAVDSAAIIHSIDVVRDVVLSWSELATDNYKVVRDIHLLLDQNLQKILEKLISIDNHLIGYQAVWVDNWKNFTVGYDGYQKFWAENFSNFSENWLKGLEITTTWLQSIYNAITGLQLTSPPTIVSPPAGTEQPAGTNFWDVLKQLIKSVADAVGKLVDAVSHLLDNLADLLKSLFVPKDTKFLDSSFKSISTKVNTKFKFFIAFGDAVKTVFSSRKAISDVSFNFQGKAVSIDLSWLRTLAGMIRPYATGAFLISSIIGLYRRVTGGDVVQ